MAQLIYICSCITFGISLIQLLLCAFSIATDGITLATIAFAIIGLWDFRLPRNKAVSQVIPIGELEKHKISQQIDQMMNLINREVDELDILIDMIHAIPTTDYMTRIQLMNIIEPRFQKLKAMRQETRVMMQLAG